MKDFRQKSKVFAYLSPDEFKDIQQYFTLLTFPANTPIIKQGNISKGLYIIKRGKLSVRTHALCLGAVTLSELGEGSFIGETSLFAAKPSSASVISSTEVDLYFMSNAFLQCFPKFSPSLSNKIIQGLIEITCYRIRDKLEEIKNLLKSRFEAEKQFAEFLKGHNKKAPVEIGPADKILKADDPLLSLAFKAFTKEETAILLPHFMMLEAEPKTLLFRTGDNNVACYFMLAGVAQRYVEADQFTAKINVCGPGEILGQVDFCDEKPRSISAITREHSQFLKLDLTQKHVLQEKYPILWGRLHYYIASEVVGALYSTNQLLMHLLSESHHV